MRPRVFRTAVRLVVLLSLPLVALPAFADVSADENVYRLGPNDIVEIAVTNHENLDKTVTILPDGTLTYAAVGKIHAAGKTTDELSAHIKRELEKTLNNVNVAVTLTESRSRQVRVVGSVKTPNAYSIQDGWRVLDLIASAGGFTARPPRITGRIIRGGELIPLEIAAMYTQPDTSNNPLLQPGDLVYFEERDPSENKVFVMGQVSRPGAYDIPDDGLSLLSLLSQAGNVTDSAALTRTHVLRGSTEIPIDLRPAIVEGKLDPAVKDFRLLAGDVLLIPTLENQVGVMGQVNKPGYFPLPETRAITPVDALTMAGGQTNNGDLKRAGIIRVVPGKPEPEFIPIDMDQLVKKGTLVSKLTLAPNDVLYVPSREQKSNTLRDILSPITSLALLGIRIFQ